MKKMIIPLFFAACFIFTGCASKTPRDAQTHKTNLGRVRLGMTTKKVSALVGPPIRVEKKVTAAPTTVEWFYVESTVHAGRRWGYNWSARIWRHAKWAACNQINFHR